MNVSDITKMKKSIVRVALCLTLAALMCLSLASCGNKKLYRALDGLWFADNGAIVIKFTIEDGVKTVSIIDTELDVPGVGGYFTIDGDVLLVNSDQAAHIGGEGSNAAIPFAYDKSSDTLTVEYNGKTVTLERWKLDLDVYPDIPDETDGESVTE